MAVTINKKAPPAKNKGGAPHKTPQQRYKRLYDLGEERKALLDSMFFEGKPVTEIITVLHDGWQVFKDVTYETLRKFLYRYKWDVIDKGLIVRMATMKDKTRERAITEFAGQIDVLEEVFDLISTQKTRVKKLLVRENEMPMLFNSLGGEMKTLAAFVQQYAELSFELGTLKRTPTLTKITGKDGAVTMVESEGRDHVSLSIEQSDKVKAAANAFYAALEVVEDGSQSL